MTRPRARLAARKTTKRRKDRWTYSYGLKPFVVFAYERHERGGQVFVRWTNLTKPDIRRPGEHKRVKALFRPAPVLAWYRTKRYFRALGS